MWASCRVLTGGVSPSVFELRVCLEVVWFQLYVGLCICHCIGLWIHSSAFQGVQNQVLFQCIAGFKKHRDVVLVEDLPESLRCSRDVWDGWQCYCFVFFLLLYTTHSFGVIPGCLCSFMTNSLCTFMSTNIWRMHLKLRSAWLDLLWKQLQDPGKTPTPTWMSEIHTEDGVSLASLVLTHTNMKPVETALQYQYHLCALHILYSPTVIKPLMPSFHSAPKLCAHANSGTRQLEQMFHEAEWAT